MNLATAVIIVIIILVICGCIYSTYKRFTGKSSCCGGGGISCCSSKRHKKPYQPMHEITVHIEGMHCKHCQNSVDSALNSIEGVYARVNLKRGIAEISCKNEISDNEIIGAIESLGFKVTDIKK